MSSMVAKPSQNCNKKHRWLFPSMFVIVSVFCDFSRTCSVFCRLVVQDLLHQSNLKLAR